MHVTEWTRAADLAWLASAEGRALTELAKSLPDDRLTRLSRLRGTVGPERASVVVELLELRKRTRARFAEADKMLFTPEGLEQATGDRIAAWRAARFAGSRAVLDACCGIGGDARRLAAHAPVLAVDLNPAAAVCAAHNSALTESTSDPNRTAGHPVHTLCADVTRLSLSRLHDRGIDAALFDPSRRATDLYGVRRRVGPRSYSPPLAWLNELRAYFASVCVKVSPGIEDAALEQPGVRVEFLSERGECKEAALWFGAAARHLPAPEIGERPYYATVLDGTGGAHTLRPAAAPPMICSPVAAYLVEPDAAVIRAGLSAQLASSLDAAPIEPGIAYLTSSQLSQTPFASAYRVLELLPYDRKEVQRWLRAHQATVSAVKKRGVPFEPAEVQRSLAPCGDRPVVLVLTKRGGKAVAIFCERC